MDIFVLIVAAIFIFAVATLFRSNEAIDRVKTVEKELGLLEDEAKEIEGDLHKVQERLPRSETPEDKAVPSANGVPTETPFPGSGKESSEERNQG